VHDQEEIFLSVLTLGEIRRGIESVRRRDPDSAVSLDSWLVRLDQAYGDRILPVDRAIVATRNVADVEGTGVDLVNPFAG